jgi:hypothetical protein
MEAPMTDSSKKLLGPLLVVAVALAIGAAAIGFRSGRHQVMPFKVDPADVVHLKDGAPTTLNDPDPKKVYVVDAGSHVTVIRPYGDPLQVKELRLVVNEGGTLEGAVGTNINVVALPGSVAHVGGEAQSNSTDTCVGGVFIEAYGAVVYATGTAKVKAMDKSIIHNSGMCDERAYAGSTTYSRMRGRVFAEDGSTVYVKSPENCDACSQVQFSPGSTIYVYEGAEAFGKGSATSGKETIITVYDGGEVGCYKYCTLILYPKAEFKEGQGSDVHIVDAGFGAPPFPDDDEPAAQKPLAKDVN